jgi:hypothetical protein
VKWEQSRFILLFDKTEKQAKSEGVESRIGKPTLGAMRMGVGNDPGPSGEPIPE